jgi:hypothetical protein
LVGACLSVATLFYAQRYTKIHFFLYGAIGILVCMIAGYFASLILPAKPKSLEGLTIFTRKRRNDSETSAEFPAGVTSAVAADPSYSPG